MFLNISTQTEQKYFYPKYSNVKFTSGFRSIFDDFKAVDQKASRKIFQNVGDLMRCSEKKNTFVKI